MSKQAVLRELSDRRLLNDVDEDLHDEIASALIRAASGAQQPCPASVLLAFLGQPPRASVDDLYFQGGIRRSEIESRLTAAVAGLVEERDTALRQAEDQWAGWIKADCRAKALREALQYVVDNDCAYLKAPSDPPPKGYPGHLAGVARAAIERDGDSQKVQEPVYKQVERILDEHSAWVARPNREVVERIALAAAIAAMTVLEWGEPE